MGKKPKKTPKDRGKMTSPIQQPSGAPVSQAATQSQAAASDKQQLIPLIKALEQARGGNRVIVYWLTDLARISEAMVLSLYDQLSSIGHQLVDKRRWISSYLQEAVTLRLLGELLPSCESSATGLPFSYPTGRTAPAHCWQWEPMRSL